jgi:hypothetical protein
MGNTLSKNVHCSMYKHADIVNAIYIVLSDYEPNLEAMCDCASWMLKELLIHHRQYEEKDVELICGKVNKTNHIWVYDKKENYYIDITSEQFSSEQPFPICFCTQNKEDLDTLGYVPTNEETAEQVCESFCKMPCVLYNKNEKITKEMILQQIKKKLKIGGKKRTYKYKSKNKIDKNQNKY